MLKGKVEKTIKNKHLTTILIDITSYNKVQIDDGKSTSKEIIQTNGVLQGDPASPILFNITTAESTKAVEDLEADIIMYADDIVIGASRKDQLQRAIDNLQLRDEENSFEINTEKTVQMIFRKGGRLATNDEITLGNDKFKIVNETRYLGITLQTTTSSIRTHIRERTAAAIKSI